ncbi:amidohydrolase family protein [Entomomonas asaccharolytica]|uniref:Amidohydrolase family protein n=1 Tax=Entomomonas asaccharolytica TaxID=2785331 RepID=A0A974NGC4_9GAMM|nr:amidohydrolase family protein [Entomomonas asaccharolytica]QQP85992.1 amidohydrolase family protein [Entomomonas asaccharolytica]
MFNLTKYKKIAHLLFTIFLSSFIFSVNARDYHYADAHLHYVDFFQDTDGMDKLLKAMDKGKIDHVMISGVAVAKKWHEDEPQKPRYYAGDDAAVYWYSATDIIIVDAVKNLPEQQRKRFHPFLTGFNPVDKLADQHIERMLQMNPGFWQGIGEIFTRHDNLTALTTGDIPRANNEALDRVYNLAAKYDLPVMLHSNITSQRERKPLYLEELEEAVKKHPKTRFIWAHAGTSAEIHRHQQKLDFLLPELKRLLKTYPNLYIDLSWTVLEPYLLNKNKKPNSNWVALVEEYPDRFLLGSDVVGKFDNLPSYLESFNPFLDALSEDVAHKVAKDNFLAILPKAVKAQQ